MSPRSLRSRSQPSSSPIPGSVFCFLAIFGIAVVLLCVALGGILLMVNKRFERVGKILSQVPTTEEVKINLGQFEKDRDTYGETFLWEQNRIQEQLSHAVVEEEFLDNLTVKVKKLVEEVETGGKTLVKTMKKLKSRAEALSKNNLCTELRKKQDNMTMYDDSFQLLFKSMSDIFDPNQGKRDEIMRNYGDKPLPKGFIYMHVEGGMAPGRLWPGHDFEEISSDSNGEYLQLDKESEVGKVVPSSPEFADVDAALSIEYRAASSLNDIQSGPIFLLSNCKTGFGKGQMQKNIAPEFRQKYQNRPKSQGIRMFQVKDGRE